MNAYYFYLLDKYFSRKLFQITATSLEEAEKRLKADDPIWSNCMYWHFPLLTHPVDTMNVNREWNTFNLTKKWMCQILANSSWNKYDIYRLVGGNHSIQRYGHP